MDLNNNVGYLLQHLSGVLAKQSDQVLRERLGIGFSQLRILMCLEVNPSARQRYIADSLGQTEASISRQIKLMQAKSLLWTKISPKNRREHMITPTTKGMRVTDEALRILNEFHAPMFGVMSEKHQQLLLDILTQMHAHSCQLGKTGACHQFLHSPV